MGLDEGASAYVSTLLQELAEQMKHGDMPVSDDERVILRFQLDVLVSLDVLDAPLEELTFWAFRAITDARRVEAMPVGIMPAGLHGELARARARKAWIAWDESELTKELSPWPSRSR